MINEHFADTKDTFTLHGVSKLKTGKAQARLREETIRVMSKEDEAGFVFAPSKAPSFTAGESWIHSQLSGWL